jgi:hypothetical protein
MLWLHGFNYGHGDLRWPNVGQRLEEDEESDLKEVRPESTEPRFEKAWITASTNAAAVLPPHIPTELVVECLEPGAFFVWDMGVCTAAGLCTFAVASR